MHDYDFTYPRKTDTCSTETVDITTNSDLPVEFTNLTADSGVPDINESVVQDRQPLKLPKRLRVTLGAAAKELANNDKKFRTIMILGGTALTAAFEMVPGLYEYFIGTVGINVLQAIANTPIGSNILWTSALTGVATGAAVASEQFIAGLLTSKLIEKLPDTLKTYDKHKIHPTSEEKKKKSDKMTGIVLGGPAAIVEQNLRDPNRSLKQNYQLAGKMAAMLFALDTVIVGGVGAGIQTLQMHGHETIARDIEFIAQKPYAYLALFGLLRINEYRKDVKKARLLTNSRI